jgi:hypothetical protein
VINPILVRFSIKTNVTMTNNAHSNITTKEKVTKFVKRQTDDDKRKNKNKTFSFFHGNTLTNIETEKKPYIYKMKYRSHLFY